MTVVLRKVYRSAYLVAFAWLVGAAALGTAFTLRVRVVQAHWLELAVLIWLAPLALYDLRRREVPHIACVAVPCLAALFHSFAAGVWPLGAVGVLAIAASERHAIRHARVGRWIFVLALPLTCVLALVSGEAVPGVFAVLGFWLAYELGWWAGVDAVVAITLAILWPDIRLLAVLGTAHMGVAVCMYVMRWWRSARPEIFTRDPVPGLPVIYLAALMHLVWGLGWPG